MNVLHLLDESCSPDSRAEARALPGAGAPLVLADNLATCLARPGAELRRRLVGVQAAVCWSARAAATAWRARRLLPVFVRLLEPSGEDDIGLLARLRAGGGSVTVVCHAPAVARQLERDFRGAVAVVPAAAIVSGDAPAARRAARQQYGLAEEDIAVIAPGRVSEASRHKQAVWAAAILREAGLPVRILMPGGGLWAREAAAFAADAGLGQCCVQAGADELDCLVAAGDLALLLHEGPIPPVSLASVMAAGVPIVAGRAAEGDQAASTPSPNAAAAGQPPTPEHERTALLVDANQPRLIAGAMLRLIEDRELARRLASEARREVAGQSLAAVADAWRALVAQSRQ